MNIVNLFSAGARRRAVGCAGAAAAVLVSLGGAAQAQPVEGGYLVKFADLNPRSPYGAQTLLRRIEYAADYVCGAEPALDLGARNNWRKCRTEAVARAVRELDAPMVSALANHTAAPVALAGG